MEKGRGDLIALHAEKKKAMAIVSSWCHQQGQGEPGGRSLMVAKLGKVGCGVYHQEGDQKGGEK